MKMKFITNNILLLLAGIQFTSAQAILDTINPYCQYISTDNGSSCFKFQKGNKFTFKDQGDMPIGGSYASGTYFVDDDYLIFKYSETKISRAAKTEISYWKNDSDSIKIRFRIINRDDWCGVPECIYYLIDSIVTKPNREWGAEFVFKKSKKPIIISTYSLYTYTNDFVFNGELNTEVILEVLHNRGMPIFDQNLKVKILKTQNSIITAFKLEDGNEFFLRM